MMSSTTSKAMEVAASIEVVESLKDQWLCRWNHALRSVQQHAIAKAILIYYFQAKKLLAPTSSALLKKLRDEKKLKQSEESLRKVKYLSCWGPN